MAKLIVSGQVEEKDLLYIRGIRDVDGDFVVQVSRGSDFTDPMDIAYFSVNNQLRKLRVYMYSRLEDFEDFLDITDKGELEVG